MIKKATSAPKAAKAVVSDGKKTVTFKIEAGVDKKVCVAGSFNDWSPESKVLSDKNNSGTYSGSIKLVPGVYEYKFVVDGEWRLDDRNSDFAPNDFGTLNSVLVVK